VAAVAAGGAHVVALKEDGTVWAWGNNGAGQLGDGSTASSTTPVQVSGLTFCKFINTASGKILELAACPG
jgi:alpha-tubulin suppressor-like RCC1 family protein